MGARPSSRPGTISSVVVAEAEFRYSDLLPASHDDTP